MNLPSLSDLDYRVGDVVWLTDGRGGKRRAVVRKVAGDHCRVECGDGSVQWSFKRWLRPYEAIDRLADLVCCDTCGERPADCWCPKFYITTVGSSTFDGAVTMTYGATASNTDTDPVSQLGNLVRHPKRQPLSEREKHRRCRQNWIAKRSRARNRRQR